MSAPYDPDQPPTAQEFANVRQALLTLGVYPREVDEAIGVVHNNRPRRHIARALAAWCHNLGKAATRRPQ
jgi:hypothetical protein